MEYMVFELSGRNWRFLETKKDLYFEKVADRLYSDNNGNYYLKGIPDNKSMMRLDGNVAKAFALYFGVKI